MSTRKRAIIICPGRGSYTRSELGSLERYRDLAGQDARGQLLEQADRLRRRNDRPTISELDGAERFKASLHLAGEHASALTYTFSVLDATRLEAMALEPVAVIGNSLGWYTALHLGGVLDFESGLRIVETTGSFQAERTIGGQLIYPTVDEEWQPLPERSQEIERAFEAAEQAGGRAFLSIRLGGYAVLAGDETGIEELPRALPSIELGRNRYPLKLLGHSAFHTPLMASMADYLETTLSLDFQSPALSLIDGRGHIWRPLISSPDDLAHYTFRHQVTQRYDFTCSLRVALREFAPDALVLLGPGSTLGGAIGQIVVAEGWQGIDCKRAFKARQDTQDPVLISLGR